METQDHPPAVRGGLLADMMGLGKTLQLLALIVDTLSDAAEFAKKQPPRTPALPLILNSKATLLVAPLSVVANWEEQIKAHIESGTLTTYVYHGSNRTQDVKQLAQHDVVITSYHTLASELRHNGTKKPLSLTNFFRVVLDEAHQIRNQTTNIFAGACNLSAQRRWCLTATPVQNKLDDLGALIKFLRIRPFEDKGAFTKFFLTPFKQADPTIMPKFRLLIDSVTIRRTKDRIDLPERIDQIVRLDFSGSEKKIYQFFVNDSARRMKAVTTGSKVGGKGYAHVLKSIMRMRLICAHGESLLSEEDIKLLEGITPGTAIDISDDDDADDKPILSQKQAFEMLQLLRDSDLDRCPKCTKKIGERDLDDENYEIRGNTNTIGHMSPCYHIYCPDCFPKHVAEITPLVDETNHMKCPDCDEFVRNVYFELKQSELDEDEQAKARVRANPKLAKQLGFYHGPHTKTKALISSLQSFEAWSAENYEEPPIKRYVNSSIVGILSFQLIQTSVIFSGWTSHLDLIQIALEAANFKYVRLDGSMARKQRAASLDAFREDPSICIILVSIGAGGLGLNLTTASKVFMMEPQFNPQAEAQAVDRVHRLGQKREVTIHRYIMRGSFEEKVLALQKKKKDLADLSMNKKLDKHEVQRAKMEELRELFK
jgi:SNF2 family DNA or RNA helicase